MYVVESCDASDAPEEREYVAQGQYARAADAIAAAQALIESHLSLALSVGMNAAQAVEDWRSAGPIPRIVVRGAGAPVSFDPIAFAQARAAQLQRRV
jgi:hypothetical protein